MIFIVGGTGKIGQELLKQLAVKNIKAKVLVRSAQKAEAVKALGHEPVEGDITNIPSFEPALHGVEKLFLLTSSTPERWAADEIAVMEAAKKAGVNQVVLISAIGVTPDSPLVLGQQHSKSEEHLKKSGMAYTILQPHAFMQNILGSAATIKQGAIYGNFKDGKVAFVDARDIAAVAVTALTEAGHENKTYLVTGGESVSYNELAAKLTALTGKEVKYVDIPSDAVIKAMMGAHMPEWLSRDLAKLGEVFAAGDGAHLTDVVEKVGKKKPITVDQFLKDNEQVFK